MRNWFVVHTKPKKEFLVEKTLKEVGIEVYNPKIQSNGRIKSFFPNYIFTRFKFPQEYRLVKYTRGTKKILENNGQPIPLDESIIKEIKSREKNGLIVFKVKREEPKLGDEVEIIEGPFKGFRGIFERKMSDSERVIILLKVVSYQAKLLIEKSKLIKAV